jgi:predicted enzyme related to lactoylglutathione lyase
MLNSVLIDIDVDDLERAPAFYCDLFGLRVTRRLGNHVLELSGGSAPIELLEKADGTRASSASPARRTYDRHWTPVHLDFVVDDVATRIERAIAGGARFKDGAETRVWGGIAHLSDPVGHGFCLLQFLNRNYDEVAV